MQKAYQFLVAPYLEMIKKLWSCYYVILSEPVMSDF